MGRAESVAEPSPSCTGPCPGSRATRCRALLALVTLAFAACAASPGPVARTVAGASGEVAASDELATVPADTDRVAAGMAAARALPVPDDVDADGDRIADGVDRCPETAVGEIVDAHGCPRFTRTLEGVVFATDDAALDASSRAALARLVADLKAFPDVVIRLEGHTDNRGLAAKNLELSKRRVMAVARFLVVSGIASERLRPYGYGESRPRAYNATAEGRERNRRIEIALERERLGGAAAPPLAEPPPARQNAPMTENAS